MFVDNSSSTRTFNMCSTDTPPTYTVTRKPSFARIKKKNPFLPMQRERNPCLMYVNIWYCSEVTAHYVWKSLGHHLTFCICQKA